MKRATACLLLVVGAASCDTRQNFEEPEWTLSRMLVQPRYDSYAGSEFFDDGRAMRPPLDDTVDRDRLLGPSALVAGTFRGGYVTVAPFPITRGLLEEGRRRFDVVCATCHGVLGDGDSIVATKMQLRKPPSLHEPRIAALTKGELYGVVTSGYGLMAGYAGLLDVRQRWSVVAYVETLQRSQRAHLAELPPDLRARLESMAP